MDVKNPVQQSTRQYTSLELAEAIHLGDSQAEDYLCRKYRSGLVLMLERRTRSAHLAEDLAQDTLVTVLQRLRDEGIENPAALARFIQQTALYTYIGWTRRRGNQELTTDMADELLRDEADPAQIALQEQAHDRVRELIGQLRTARDRDILYRYYVKQQAKAVICEELDLLPDQFDKVISRARSRFRQLMDEDAQDA